MKENDALKGFDKSYWTGRWTEKDTGWDVGYASTPLKTWMEHQRDKSLKILIPGAGNAYEGVLLNELGFKNTYILDISDEPLNEIKKNHPNIPAENLLLGDFFEQEGQYDIILEQTFFCAIHPSLRRKYFEKCYALLKPGGMIVGVLFNDKLNDDHPPFGGSSAEYKPLFEDLFTAETYETCYNSIKPREGRELFIRLRKK